MHSLQLNFHKRKGYSIREKRRKREKKHLTMNSATIDIPNEDKTVLNQKKKFQFPLLSYVSSLMEKTSKHDTRKMIHSIKVGIALVLVSLLYLLDPLFKEVGENAMWAIMTVVVVFEFFAGLSYNVNNWYSSLVDSL